MEEVTEEWANFIVKVTATVSVPIPSMLGQCLASDRTTIVWTTVGALLILAATSAGVLYSTLRTIFTACKELITRRLWPDDRFHDPRDREPQYPDEG